MNSLDNLIEGINSIAGGVHNAANRVRSLVDKIVGELPPGPDTQIIPPSKPPTVSQAVAELHHELELLNVQFDRLDTEVPGTRPSQGSFR